MEYDRLKPLPVWLILEYASSVRPDTYIIFTDRGNHIPSDIQTYGINVFDVSLKGNENQSHGAVIIVSWYTTYIWYVKLTWSWSITSIVRVSIMVITFRLATAKSVPNPGWNLTRLPAWNSFLYKSFYSVILFWIL